MGHNLTINPPPVYNLNVSNLSQTIENTDSLPEGVLNLYYTPLRAISDVHSNAEWKATDWNTAFAWGDHSSAGYVLSINLGSSAYKDVPLAGNATITQVVLGSDTRLSDSRDPNPHIHAPTDIVGLENISTDLIETQTALDNKVDKVLGKGLSSEDFTTEEKIKLFSIEDNAQVNVVTSVASKTGDVVIDKSDVGLGNVDNTSDLDKPVSTATYFELQNKVDKILGKQLSSNDFTDNLKSKLDGIEDGAQVNVVTSVSGKIGAVVLNKTDVGLNLVDNTPDLDKPVSTATQAVLDTKVNVVPGKQLSNENYTITEKTKLANIEYGAQVNKVTSVMGRTGDVVVTKEDIGLQNVENTADIDKPISTATQTALNTKFPYSGGTLTGKLTTIKSTASLSPFNIQPGIAPENSVIGDIWYSNNSIQANIEGTTRSILHSGSYSTVLETEARTGTSTTIRWWSAQRVRQSTAEYAYSKVETNNIVNTKANSLKIQTESESIPVTQGQTVINLTTLSIVSSKPLIFVGGFVDSQMISDFFVETPTKIVLNQPLQSASVLHVIDFRVTSA